MMMHDHEVRGSIYQQRVFIVSSKTRKLLKQMAKTGRHLDRSEFATLLSELRKGNLHSLVPLLTNLRENILLIADPFADLFLKRSKGVFGYRFGANVWIRPRFFACKIHSVKILQERRNLF